MKVSTTPIPAPVTSLLHHSGIGFAALLAAIVCLPAAAAQSAEPNLFPASSQVRSINFVPIALEASAGSSSTSLEAEVSLPEAPVPQLATEPKPKRGTDPAQHIARKSTKVIPSDWHAQRLNTGDKVRVGVDGILSVENLASVLLAAGYEHLLNAEPNYGSDKGAFGERLGAAAIRGTSQTAFSDMVFAPILHEDPRYYVEGPQYSPVHRGIYAITRPFITRKDDGSSTINGSLLLGYATAAALTPAYYPQADRSFRDTVSTYGGSIGGAALGFFLTEFSEDLLRSVHLSHAP